MLGTVQLIKLQRLKAGSVNWFKTAFAVVILLSFNLSLRAQSITYDTTIGGWNAKITMRADFNSSKDSVQGIVFIPGTGECGTDIRKLQIYGPHYWMTKGWDGSVMVNNQKHYPVIISLQPTAVNQRPTALKTKIDDILKRFRIKRNSLHLTGISQGGWVVNVFATYKPSENDYSFYNMVRTIVNVQGVVPDDTYNASLKYPAKFGDWAKHGGKALWFEQANDGRKMEIGSDNMNSAVSGSSTYFKTNFGNGGHSDFDKMYDPNATWTASNSKIVKISGNPVSYNIYQWMLMQGDNSGSAPQPEIPKPNTPPVSNAGINQTITLPVSKVTLTGTGTDADGTVETYTWKQESGPSTAKIVSATVATTEVNTLVEGVYIFSLTVKDNLGASASSRVEVTVKPVIVVEGPDEVVPPSPPVIKPPVEIPTPANHIIVGLGEYQTFFIDQNGKLFGLSSSKSAVGAGVSGGSAVPAVPVAVPSSLKFIDVASGLHHSLAVDNNGEVWCWGWNEMGQSGNGTTKGPIYTPEKVIKDSLGNFFNGIVKVAAYYSANAYSGNVALKSNGTVWVWGHTGGGIRGNGSEGKINTTPVQVSIPGNRKITKIIAAQIILALAEDGTVWSWGGAGMRNQNLGSGSNDFRTPLQVKNLPSNITDIAGASNFFYALTSDGIPYGWGYYGSYLGIGEGYVPTNRVSTPVNLTNELKLPFPIKSIVCNTVSTHAILTDGTLWGWGDNAQGTIGNGEQINFMNYSKPFAWTMGQGQLMQTKPVQILKDIKNFTHLFGGTAYVFYKYALTADGKLYSWGRNKGGVLGNGVIAGDASVGSAYPNSWDVRFATWVDPLNIKQAIVQASPYCVAYPSSSVCKTPHIAGKLIVNGGGNQTIIYPENTVLLSGNAVGPNGPIVDYTWKKVSGPDQFILSGSKGPVNSVSGLKPGIYQFEIEAKDYEGYTGTDIVTITVTGEDKSPNKAPNAIVGDNISITLPINSIQLDGNNSADEDGQIASYQWTKISGPESAQIVTPNSRATKVNNLTEGFYIFELIVTDNDGAIGKAQLTVTVTAAPNRSPAAHAGENIVIKLPINKVEVSGLGSKDDDGTISEYLWIKVSGPNGGNIVANSEVNTAINNLQVGEYVFELIVTDNQGATDKARISITVLPKDNDAPLAVAGQSSSITLPTNIAALDGSLSTDADGTIITALWKKLSGPSVGQIADPNAIKTTANNLVEGKYVFELTVTDNNNASSKDQIIVTVLPRPNQEPTAVAGANISITLPTNSAELNGTESSDSDGVIASYYWTKKSGPKQGKIITETAATTLINELVEGVYVFELTVTDKEGATATDQVTVRVNATVIQNSFPVAIAGTKTTITLPLNHVTLNGSASYDTDGKIESYRWVKLEGPAAGLITSASSASTTVTGLNVGTYVFELTVTDNEKATDKALVEVVVQPVPNKAPVANAGVNLTITLPVNSVTLNGSDSKDEDGDIVSFRWVKLNGPAAGSIISASSASTTVTGLTVGTYIYELTVKDNAGASSHDIVEVIVHPVVNKAPSANAGVDVTITLPENKVTLNGSSSKDTDGTIESYNWAKISGPASGFITTASAISTTVTGLVAGTYEFELSVKDNAGAYSSDRVKVTVLPATNKAPVAKAGSNHTITLPANTVTLNGNGSTDSDGSIVTYSWVKKSGPAMGSLTEPSKVSTTVTGLTAGTYQYELTVTDNSGASSSDVVEVKVLPAPNIVPVAIAQAILETKLLLKIAKLDGSQSYDTDGKIVAYKWIQLAGPSVSKISNPNAGVTTVTGLISGKYQYELCVTDDKGATATKIVEVMVESFNQKFTVDMNIYPNPVGDNMNLVYESDQLNEKIQVVVYGLNGRAMVTRNFTKDAYSYKMEINVAFLNKGFYLVELRSGMNNKIVKKVMKK